jgi:hypothetical protein
VSLAGAHLDFNFRTEPHPGDNISDAHSLASLFLLRFVHKNTVSVYQPNPFLPIRGTYTNFTLALILFRIVIMRLARCPVPLPLNCATICTPIIEVRLPSRPYNQRATSQLLRKLRLAVLYITWTRTTSAQTFSAGRCIATRSPGSSVFNSHTWPLKWPSHRPVSHVMTLLFG